MKFPEYRARRTRRTPTLRNMVRETRLAVDDFIYPLFCVEGNDVCNPISSMPGVSQMSIDRLAVE